MLWILVRSACMRCLNEFIQNMFLWREEKDHLSFYISRCYIWKCFHFERKESLECPILCTRVRRCAERVGGEGWGLSFYKIS